MTALALRPSPALPIVSQLFARQPILAALGCGLALLAVPALAMTGIDPVTLPNGASPWVKPVKFLVSTSLFTLTAAWFFGYVRPERRGSRLMQAMVGTLIVSTLFEIGWIVRQAARGVDSHFNGATPLDAVMFNLMGVFALLLTATSLMLAWEIGRRPAAGITPDYRAAVVTGLVLTFVLGSTAGMMMGANGSHAVGAEGAGLPILGWNRLGGDLRVGHFLGIHAEQVIPAFAALIAGRSAPERRGLIAGAIILYAAVTVAVLAQAMAGQPLLPA